MMFFLFFFLFFKEDQKNDFFLIIQLNKDRKIPMQPCGNYLERLTDGWIEVIWEIKLNSIQVDHLKRLSKGFVDASTL